VIIKIDPTDFNLQCFWTASRQQLQQCRDAVEIDHANGPRLNKQTLAANVFNLGYVPRVGLDSQRLGGF